MYTRIGSFDFGTKLKITPENFMQWFGPFYRAPLLMTCFYKVSLFIGTHNFQNKLFCKAPFSIPWTSQVGLNSFMTNSNKSTESKKSLIEPMKNNENMALQNAPFENSFFETKLFQTRYFWKPRFHFPELQKLD